MSYDLMVFEAKKAPKEKREFLLWYFEQVKWEETHDYSDPSVSSKALQNWFFEMKETFPAMNGAYAPKDETLEQNPALEDYLTDYSFGQNIIYAAFAWSLSDEAYQRMRELAKKHNVGFFDVSGNSEVIYPTSDF